MVQTISNQPITGWNKITNLFGTSDQKETAAKQCDARVASAMHRVIGEEQDLKKKALGDKSRRYPISVIGGDILNIGLLGCIGATVFSPASVLMNFVASFSMLGGLLNLAQSLLCFKEGIAAWKSNNKELAVRLMLQGIVGLALGTAMILYSVAQFCAIAGIAAFFAANPYVIPVLFFAFSILLLIETMHRLKPVIEGTDLGTKLNLPYLKSIMQMKDPDQRVEAASKWVHTQIKECFSSPPGQEIQTIRKKLDEFKAEIGLPASLETFKLFEMILENKKKEEIADQIKKVEQNIHTWNRMLWLKVASVVICAAGFGVGMGAMAAKSPAMDGVQNLAMSVGNIVPLYLDVRRPFEREIPIVVSREEKVG